MRLSAALLLTLAGCLPEPGDPLHGDSGSDVVDSEGPDYGCDETTLRINGPDDPIVGDEWVVLIICDGGVLQGPMVLQFDPPGFASIDAPTVTFTQAGDAHMRVQVGVEREEMDVTVSEP